MFALHVHDRTNYINGRHNESCVSQYTSVQKMRICVLFIASSRILVYTDYIIVYSIPQYSFRMCISTYVYARACACACSCVCVHRLYKRDRKIYRQKLNYKFERVKRLEIIHEKCSSLYVYPCICTVRMYMYMCMYARICTWINDDRTMIRYGYDLYLHAENRYII